MSELLPWESSLRELADEEFEKSLDTLETLLRKVVQNPMEDKFRRIRLSNPKIHEAITSIDSALESLLLLGWELEDDETLSLPPTTTISADDIGRVLAAKKFLYERRKAALSQKTVSQSQQSQNLPSATQKSAFQFSSRAAKEEQERRAEDELSRIQKEKQNQFKLDQIQRKENEGFLGSVAASLGSLSLTTSETPTTTGSQNQPPQTEMATVKKVISKPENVTAMSPNARASKIEQKLISPTKPKAESDDLRALQRQKYEKFRADPNAMNSEIYQRPASVAPGGGGGEEGSWWNPFSWGASSSSGTSGGGPGPSGSSGGSNQRPRGPKTIGDLPKPPQRG